MNSSIHVVCIACSAVNRVPEGRLDDQPRCARCRQPLFAGKPAPLTVATFDRQIGRTDLPVIVDFWAPWCGPCHAMAPVFEQATRRLEPLVRFAKLDTESEPSIATRFGIRSIPTLIAFRGGSEAARQSGAMSLEPLLAWIAQVTAVR